MRRRLLGVVIAAAVAVPVGALMGFTSANAAGPAPCPPGQTRIVTGECLPNDQVICFTYMGSPVQCVRRWF